MAGGYCNGCGIPHEGKCLRDNKFPKIKHGFPDPLIDQIAGIIHKACPNIVMGQCITAAQAVVIEMSLKDRLK